MYPFLYPLDANYYYISACVTDVGMILVLWRATTSNVIQLQILHNSPTLFLCNVSLDSSWIWGRTTAIYQRTFYFYLGRLSRISIEQLPGVSAMLFDERNKNKMLGSPDNLFLKCPFDPCDFFYWILYWNLYWICFGCNISWCMLELCFCDKSSTAVMQIVSWSNTSNRK